jgi:hypothetical protein
VTAIHNRGRQVHQQHSRIQSSTTGPQQIVSNRSLALHSKNRFQSNSKPNREGMHDKGRNSREILSHRPKDGKFLQRIYSGTYRKSKERRSI